MSSLSTIKRKYSFSEYDPNWVNQFNDIKNFLMGIFGDAVVQIEHVGSTSIPGMKAKPIIDVLVVVNNMQDFAKEKEQMVSAGYEWGANYIAPNTLIFFKQNPGGEKTENIHVCEAGSQKEKQFIIMRDFFRAHPEKARQYTDLKEKNSQIYSDDYPAYRSAKKPFLDEIEQEARKWEESMRK